MKNKSGLKRITKTVRGKKGSVTRTYWVKQSGGSTKPNKRALKSGGAEGSQANMIYRTGLINAGRTGLAIAGLRHGYKDGRGTLGGTLGGAVGGFAAGHVLGREVANATSRHLSNKAKTVVGTAAHLGAFGGAVYNAYAMHNSAMRNMRHAFPGQR